MATNYILGAEELFRSAANIAGDGGTFTPVGFFPHAIRIVTVINNTDTLLQFNYDTDLTHVNFSLPPNTQVIKDIMANRELRQEGLWANKNTQFWVKYRSVAPTAGGDFGVYISADYARGD